MSARWIVRSLGPLLAAAVPAAFAQPAGPPKPAPEMSQLKYFAGTWRCEGDAPASPMGPAHKSRSTVAIRLDLGGFWYSGTVREEKTPGNPNPLSGMFHETYDTGKKQILMLWVDNYGGWATETTKGWDGDKIVYEGEGAMGGKMIPGRDTFVKKGPAELVHTAEMKMDGRWTKMVEETCKKAPAAPARK